MIALSTRIPKIYFFQGGPNFGEGRSENLGKMGNNRDIYCYANWWEVNFERAYQPLPPGTKILVMPQFSYMLDQFLGKKWKEPNFDFFLGSFPPKIQGRIQKIFIWPNVFGYRLGIAKISLKNLNSFLSYPEKTWGGQNDPPLVL